MQHARLRIPARTASLLVFALGVAVVLGFPAHHDVTWFLYMAKRLLAGDALYVDIVDVNPPLIVLMGVPAQFLAHLGLWDVLGFRLFTLVLCALTIGLVELITRSLALDRATRNAVVLLCVIAFLLLESVQFGQREHLAFVLVTPWVLAAAARAAGRPLTRWAAVATGFMAGLGFAMKPHFLAAWAALEVFRWVAAPRPRAPARPWTRPELVALLVTISVYSAGVALLTPAYFEVAGFASRAYAGFAEVSIWRLLFTYARSLAVLLACALALVMASSRGDRRKLQQALAVAALGFLLAAAAQRKGWTYQWIPATGFAFVAAGATVVPAAAVRISRLVAGSLPRGGMRWFGLRGPVVAGTLILCAALLAVHQVRAADLERLRLANDLHQLGQLLPIVERHAAAGPIAALSITMLPAFPLVNYADTDWGLRFNSLWGIAALYRSGDSPGYRSPADMSRDERYMYEGVVTDLLRRPPALLIVDTLPFGGRSAFDWLGYFGQDDGVRRLLREYQPLTRVAQYVVLKRNSNAVGEAQ